MNNSGHVSLHRKVRDNPLWKLSPATFKLHAHCIMEANWKPSTGYDGIISFPIPVGSFQTTLRKLAEDCFLSVQQVRDGLAHLERLGIISTHSRTHRYTVVTVRNYKRYNSRNKPENTVENTQCVPEHVENTPRTQSEHSLAFETRVNPANSNEFSPFVYSSERSLKEEEVKKGRRERRAHSPPPLALEPEEVKIFEEIYARHPVAGFKEQASVQYVAKLKTARDPLAAARAVNQRHADWCAHWAVSPAVRIPQLQWWFADDCHMKQPPRARGRPVEAPRRTMTLERMRELHASSPFTAEEIERLSRSVDEIERQFAKELRKA
jgi:hypothetical protein